MLTVSWFVELSWSSVSCKVMEKAKSPDITKTPSDTLEETGMTAKKMQKNPVFVPAVEPVSLISALSLGSC